MRRPPVWIVIVTTVLMLSAAACGRPSASQVVSATGASTDAVPSNVRSASPTPSPTVAPIATPAPTPTMDPAEPAFATLDPANFTNSTVIDNVWMPYKPGTEWVVEGVLLEDGERIPHRITFAITDLTKEIGGVRTVVAWIEDRRDGELVEKEIAFYAQDDDGTVWYLGEHPEEYEGGALVKAPTWIAGIAGAQAGIKMVAEPEVGMQTWYQGWAPAVDWSDYGRVDAIGLDDCVVIGCYTDVLRMAESSLGEEGTFQIKSYARGVGEIRVGWRGEAESREELELIEVRTLSPEALAGIRSAALELEAHAYEISLDVYALSEPSR